MLTNSTNYQFDKKTDVTPLKNTAIRGGGLTLVTHFLDYGIQLISTAIIARILEPSDYGLIAISLTVTGFFFIFRTLGLTDATVQRETITHSQVSTLFWINAFAGIVLTILLILIAPLIANTFKESRLTSIISVSAFTYLIAGFSTQHQALLKRSMRFFELAINEVIAILISVIIAIIMAFAGFGFWVLVFRPLIYNLSSGIGFWFFCKWRPGFPSRKSGIKPLVKFGTNTIAYYIVDYFSKNLDKTLIGWRFGTVSLGFYSKAFQLFLAPVSQLTIPLSSVAVSTLSKLRKTPSVFHSYYLNAVQTIAFIGFPVSMYMAANSRTLINILLGEKWLPAADIFSILGLAAGIQLITSTRAWLFVSLGRTDRWLYTGIVTAFFMIIFVLIGVQFGTSGTAIAYTSFVYISLSPSLWFAGQPIGLQFKQIFSILWKPFTASIMAAAINWISMKFMFENVNLLYKFLLSIVLFFPLYCGLLIALNRNIKPFIDFLNLLKVLNPKEKEKQDREV
jgi:PST family polysaccharide transporter